MAQAATMGPPLSPRETRRSGRRSAPSVSTASKSPDSDQPPRQKENTLRPSVSANASNPRNKRPKQEDLDDSVDDRKNNTVVSTTPASPTVPTVAAPTAAPTTNGASKQKRKPKDKEKEKEKDKIPNPPPPHDVPLVTVEPPTQDPQEEEEQGITRCVCGSTEDDPDAGEFMVQCETCKVWQHGLCMGYQSEDQVHDDDYYCEQCRPELHVDLLKKLAKKPRHSSTNSHHTTTAVSRVSRSHSPSHLKQPSKRRNTMNSRDAAFDESLKEIIEATAAEAAAQGELVAGLNTSNVKPQTDPEDEPEPGPNNRKKRKRTEDDAPSKKRTRSASTSSDRQDSSAPRADTPSNGVQNKVPVQASIPPIPKASGRNKRGGRKNVPAVSTDPNASIEVDEGATPTILTKRHGGGGRAKGSNSRRPPLSHSTSHGGNDHGGRRNQSGAGISTHNAGSSNAESSRAYRNSHAYAVSQQPLYTSWGLPDYLAHLEAMLPSEVPQPLEVRSSAMRRGDSVEHTTERGVKVKWPGKRMSVGDMNKRVRALVEWVGREQASALDRERRKEALEKALKEEAERAATIVSTTVIDGDGDVTMALDDGFTPRSSENKPTSLPAEKHKPVPESTKSNSHIHVQQDESKSTMKLMEELMEELIRFQERFGPGARSRERRAAVVS
ncbi:hypothetical protein BDQ17DRAFT_1343753 [Cyathus striatus]|nr:hypothetical protein BDQ17DRAFT_1343753 [Cyathus striatus]